MRVLFWGTPEFAASPLRALVGEGFDVVGVVTQPDKPHGRSRSELVPPPVKVVAEAEQIPVEQPERPRGDGFIAKLQHLEPDISIVAAYGHILPRAALDVPKMGTFNVHASLLPLLRGASPIQAAIRDGHAETGITIMRMVEELDAGPIVHQATIPILPDETYGELQLRLTELGAQTLIEALALIEAGAAQEKAQDDAKATYAGKITREMARVDWAKSAVEIARVIRAYDPKPGAWTTLRNEPARLFGARAVDGSGMPGTVLSADASGIIVAAGQGAVRILELHPAGRKRMTAAQIAAGRVVTAGERLS